MLLMTPYSISVDTGNPVYAYSDMVYAPCTYAFAGCSGDYYSGSHTWSVTKQEKLMRMVNRD